MSTFKKNNEKDIKKNFYYKKLKKFSYLITIFHDIFFVLEILYNELNGTLNKINKTFSSKVIISF
jgi:hypothetical protein